MKMKAFLISNWAYLLWAIVYMLIASLILSNFYTISYAIVLTILIYGFSVGIALSPLGEILLQISKGVRKPSTREEIDYLTPLYEEVYETAKEENSKLNDSIQIYIDNSMMVNAYAIGRKTIAVTMGALNTFSEEELKGVLAHELGHISHGDTKGLLLNYIGNGFFSVFILFANIVIRFLQTMVAIFSGRHWWITPVLNLIIFIANLYILAFQLIGELILALNSRQSEYFADKFAYTVGYGEDLTAALYLLQRIEMPANVPVLERLKASHPHTANRIQRLEEMCE